MLRAFLVQVPKTVGTEVVREASISGKKRGGGGGHARERTWNTAENEVEMKQVEGKGRNSRTVGRKDRTMKEQQLAEWRESDREIRGPLWRQMENFENSCK